jgi:hypothetical protein
MPLTQWFGKNRTKSDPEKLPLVSKKRSTDYLNQQFSLMWCEVEFELASAATLIRPFTRIINCRR